MEFTPTQILIVQKMVDTYIIKNEFDFNTSKTLYIEISSDNYKSFFPDIPKDDLQKLITTMYPLEFDEYYVGDYGESYTFLFKNN